MSFVKWVKFNVYILAIRFKIHARTDTGLTYEN